MSDRVLNLHTFSDEASANEYTGGDAELTVVVPDDGSEPALHIHDGEKQGGYEIGCKCNEGECSDACKQYVDDRFNNIVVSDLSPIIGIVPSDEVIGSEGWPRVDIEGRPLWDVPKSYFNFHPTYSAIKRVIIDGQTMQEHKKFYFKAFTIPDGELEGKTARMISPYKVDETWKVFPSFMKNGQEIDKWWCGTYQASVASSIARSVPNVNPTANISNTRARTYCRARNKNGVTGFDMLNIYQWAEIQLLALIEAGTPDSQLFYGRGNVDDPSAPLTSFKGKKVDDEAVASASWRGHVGLWCNLWCMLTGIKVAANTGKVMLWKNDGTQTYVTTNHVDPLNNTPPATFSFIKGLVEEKGEGYDFNEIFFPRERVKTVEESSIPDWFVSREDGYNWQDDEQVAHVGGSHMACSDGAGLFSLVTANVASSYFWTVGTRISKTPDV